MLECLLSLIARAAILLPGNFIQLRRQVYIHVCSVKFPDHFFHKLFLDDYR
jgi:hypothetical protein